MKTLVDSSVLLDIFTEDPKWFDWSASSLASHAEQSVLVINPIIYAEVSAHFSRIEELEAALPRTLYIREDLPWEAAFLAGRCFVNYRRRGGVRSAPMPDFYIGAHAAIKGLSVITRDPRRIRDYFPGVTVICPE